ncbi:hypothetical protein [Pseudooceanicola sp. MF1-13]|uniref:hypothetical protein n=1 Tax=Pseudooceanicola sp. MF1-13 TaxID=3379095 RepID=UPI00389290B9
MTRNELDRQAHDFIDEITNVAPGRRHVLLPRLHEVMGSYSRAGCAAPVSLRRLLDEITDEAVQVRFENLTA